MKFYITVHKDPNTAVQPLKYMSHKARIYLFSPHFYVFSLLLLDTEFHFVKKHMYQKELHAFIYNPN